jgi:ubiquinone/menaquinone biosynthesis C-methylase UbiE
MTKLDVRFAGSIPAIYDRLLVPLIFEPYAQELASRLAKLNPAGILETAAGTGVVTRAMAHALPEARITATDLNPSMLSVAQERQPEPTRIAWSQADAMDLPFDDKSFDAVVCQFGVMFFPDRVQGYREARRALKRGGAFLFDAWDSVSENPFVDVIASTVKEIYSDDPPDFIARVPHGYHDPREIERDLKAAGFAGVKIEHVAHMARAASARDAATAWCQGTPLRNEIELRGQPGLEKVTSIASDALERKFGKGAIEGQIKALIVTASG